MLKRGAGHVSSLPASLPPSLPPLQSVNPASNRLESVSLAFENKVCHVYIQTFLSVFGVAEETVLPVRSYTSYYVYLEDSKYT